eukprot:CAMPEP_0116993266 /NCGR_PEP_ID=MMETSP0467-20121206/67361_1 /TAXON_ID=283647 /ORGANISM="Mesodinium pulex, Strain SPMC105" /LENGTH=66 /DNA_ID=CAMNT_0004690967 /DNA_START=625 /DNA_END=822 /DNA_ORIENTATION=-
MNVPSQQKIWPMVKVDKIELKKNGVVVESPRAKEKVTVDVMFHENKVQVVGLNSKKRKNKEQQKTV